MPPMLSSPPPRRRRSRTGHVVGALLASVFSASLASSVAHADPIRPTAPAEKPTAPVLVAPKVKTRVEPAYPPEKLKAGERATVVVELKIDATGAVVGAKVVTTAGPEFDQAALDAAPKLTFEPATKNGEPIAAAIKWRFNFDFEEVAAPPPDTKPDTVTIPTPPIEAPKGPKTVISGTIRTPMEVGLVGAKVRVERAGDPKSSLPLVVVDTDASGHFDIVDLPVGKYRLTVDAEGFVPLEITEEVTDRPPVPVIYRPRAKAEGDDIVIHGDRPPREVTKRTMEQREITRIPGTNGDAIRSVQSMPGVARPPGLAGLIIIRGSAPQDTNFFVDGSIIPIIFHFGGLSSVIPSELVDKLDYYPGNFSPEYGRVMGGIIDVGVKSPRREGVSGLVQFDLIDGRMVIEAAVDKTTRFTLAARRSWVDVWLKPVLESVGTGVSTAPVYYDYQLMVEHDFSPSTTGRVLFFGSDDRLAITLNSPASSDPALGGDISTHTGFYRLQTRMETRVTESTKWTNTFAIGRDFVDFALGDYFFNLNVLSATLRSDLRTKISKEASLVVGADLGGGYWDVSVRFPPPPAPGQAPGPFFALPARTQSGSGWLSRPAVYAMLDLSPTKALKILPGVRVDYFSDTGKWEPGPRLAVRWDLHQEFPRTTLKGGAGLFLQPPQPQQSLPPFGTRGLGDNRATHYDLGVEQEVTRQLDVSLDGFYKDLQGLVVQHADSTSSSGVGYDNKGSGRVYGAEVLIRYRPDDLFFGWISYTLSRSERRDDASLPFRLFQFDQTHILTVLGSVQLGRGWEFGA
ncbi:MAG: TonB-dependent receptor domain-containing protein, partial [Polyangiales bacterium]